MLPSIRHSQSAVPVPPVLPIPAQGSDDSIPAASELQIESPEASRWSLSCSKRLFDIVVAALVLAAFALPMLVIAFCICASSDGPAIFTQKRMGRRGRLFSIYKFRSMAIPFGIHVGPGLTREGDRRITVVGRWLRKLKLDELPQFYNVLRGDMSLVGPRPKLPQYVAIRNMPYRPGITGPATLAFRSEETILSRVHPSQLETFYNRHIRPLKARMDADYMDSATCVSDCQIIAGTLLACIAPETMPEPYRSRSMSILAFQPHSTYDDALRQEASAFARSRAYNHRKPEPAHDIHRAESRIEISQRRESRVDLEHLQEE
jgi:lipopolysaccharide/colanic/teichoic acid biosynthesis glycosyltransferase